MPADYVERSNLFDRAKRGAVEFIRPTIKQLQLTQAQQRVAGAQDLILAVIGPPGSGKTTALAAYAAACRARGRNPLIVCSHESGCAAFREALSFLGADPQLFKIATLAEHAAHWMRSAYLAAGVAPQLTVGGSATTREILAVAAEGLLDMTWPMFASADLNLDLPYLSRPEAFLDEVASLFALLLRARISPQEFEEGCACGLAAFYGEKTERAVALLQDPVVRERASARGREACRAGAQSLAAQRKAERDTAVILAQLYREYLRAASAAPIRSAEDVIAVAIQCFSSDERSVRSIARNIDAFIVDDAEDAEPGLGALVQTLRSQHAFPLVMAGYEPARVDGFEGRRSALSSFGEAARMELPPLVPKAPERLQRFGDEIAEAQWLAQEIADLMRQGAQPEGIALLCRSEDAAAVYAKFLRGHGLPAALPASMLERSEEIADLLALCALVDNPLDQAHLLRVLSSPVVGLSDASLWALCRDPAERQQLTLEVGTPVNPPRGPSGVKPDMLARNFMGGSADAALPEAARVIVSALRADLAQWRAQCREMPPAQKFLFLAEAAGFRDRWHAAPPHERLRLTDDLSRAAQALSLAASLWKAPDFGSMARLIEDKVVPLRLATRSNGSVVCDSIVAAKGLRFEHVFVAGVAHERFPRIYTSHAMAFSRTYGLIVRENVTRGAAQTAKFAWYYAKFGAKALYLDEERRTLSYGLSRGTATATATGFGTPPHWARDHDLLAGLENGEPAGSKQAPAQQ